MIVEPLNRPPDATVRLPGSKSITNRAVLAAAMAEGMSTLTGALVADDTEAMVDAARALGATVERTDRTWTVTGTGGVPPVHEASIDARQAGTVARFVLAVALLEFGEWLTGEERSDEAEPLLSEARAIFERLGARPWLERTATISGRALAATEGTLP